MQEYTTYPKQMKCTHCSITINIQKGGRRCKNDEKFYPPRSFSRVMRPTLFNAKRILIRSKNRNQKRTGKKSLTLSKDTLYPKTHPQIYCKTIIYCVPTFAIRNLFKIRAVLINAWLVITKTNWWITFNTFTNNKAIIMDSFPLSTPWKALHDWFLAKMSCPLCWFFTMLL